MLFFTAHAAPDPGGLILDAGEAALQQAIGVTELRAAAAHTAWILARARKDRYAGR